MPNNENQNSLLGARLDPTVDNLRCPKCRIRWNARGEYDYDLAWWHYYDNDICPSGCKNFFGIKIRGKLVK